MVIGIIGSRRRNELSEKRLIENELLKLIKNMVLKIFLFVVEDVRKVEIGLPKC